MKHKREASIEEFTAVIDEMAAVNEEEGVRLESWEGCIDGEAVSGWIPGQPYVVKRLSGRVTYSLKVTYYRPSLDEVSTADDGWQPC